MTTTTHKFIIRLITPLLYCALSFSALAANNYQPGHYNFDPAHTRVTFIAPHFVISEVEGHFNDIKGHFELTENFADTYVEATVAIDSIDTGVKQRDDHLRSKDFFEVAKYPTMRLVSKAILGTPEHFQMTATLTIKDVTQDVIFDCIYTGSVLDPMGDQRAAFQASAVINRKDFHINYDQQISIGSAVGEDIKIKLWIEGIKVKTAKK